MLFHGTDLPDFNPLSPHGERPTRWITRGEGCRFQSTLPAWGETQGRQDALPSSVISIHSPRMGRDFVNSAIIILLSNFNPLSPHGERQEMGGNHTASIGRISIHSPRMGRDCLYSSNVPTFLHFNPLSPHGERHYSEGNATVLDNFNPLSPHGERHLCCFVAFPLIG